jgi:hypothetical protein
MSKQTVPTDATHRYKLVGAGIIQIGATVFESYEGLKLIDKIGN